MSKKYKVYLKSKHWKNTVNKYIRDNHRAFCRICYSTSRLELHHLNYDNLYKERLNKDVLILCHNCHHKIHFYFFNLMKVPLNKTSLKNSLVYRKFTRAFILATAGAGIIYITFLLAEALI